MAFMTWNDSYSVGVKAIDQQHAGLFAMVNELHTAMMNGQAKSVVGALLEKLVKYTVEHFDYEEKMMQAAKYPSFEAHHTHHVELKQQVGDFMARYKRGDSAVNIELLQFLSDWLTKHIQREDKQYSPFLTRRAA
jgi:hemerythrin